MYVIRGADKCVIVDTGCGGGDLRGFLDARVNPGGLPYVVVCTHVHFDHVGANHQFAGCPIAMGNANPKFTENYGPSRFLQSIFTH